MVEDIGFLLGDKAIVYKEIAYHDSLTGIRNRYAFDKDVKESDLSTLCLISFDINNFKYFNDFYGHSTGDKLICDSADLLKKVYSNIYIELAVMNS